jgi:hypothetical protein
MFIPENQLIKSKVVFFKDYCKFGTRRIKFYNQSAL